MALELTAEEEYVLEQVLYAFNFLVPVGSPEWYDLSERTKRSPERTISILNTIRSKLTQPVK